VKKALPWIVVGACVAWIVFSLIPREKAGFSARAFGQLPVLKDGRIQPMDSVGRNVLRQLRNKQSVYLGDRKSMSATEWLMEVTMKPEAADGLKVFRIDNDEVKSFLDLPVGEKHFSFNQISSNYPKLQGEGRRISDIEAKQRTVFESQTYKLYVAASLYQRLKVTLKPAGTDDFLAELADYEKAIGPGMASVQAQQQGRTYNTNAFNTLVNLMANYSRAAQFGLALVIPLETPEHTRNDWQTMGEALMEAAHEKQLPPAVGYYASMVSAYRADHPAAFNEALAKYQGWLDQKMQPEVKKGREEYAFNFVDPFYKAAVLYVLALLVGFGFLMTWSETARKASVYLVFLAWVLHTIGLLARMYLEKRPPVTNLYSSAVFIGWGSVLFGLILERFSRIGIGAIVAALVGFVTQVIAINLAVGGDTMEMMRAVLDSNFWLATHVVTITIGYSAMFVAGLLAILYVVLGVFGRRLGQSGGSVSANAPEDSLGRILGRMIYSVICLATLFSFVGTVLGGIWADQSWGRFWGWDPKENGALLIVIWCAVILHARWSGMVRERGIALLAIFGNIITAWSWFGVNMLGVGLHSYGFMDSAFKWLVIFDLSQFALIGIGLLPLRYWRSFRNGSEEPASVAPAGAR